MDYEKKYNEALERAKGILNVNPSRTELGNIMESIFPELRESEDDRIRKSLIELVEQFMADERKEKTLTWLERQKEQKPAVSEHDAYELLSKKGYVVIEREVYNEPCEKAEQKPDNKCKGCNNVKGCINCVDGSEWAHIEEIEQKPAWSEEDKANLDNIIWLCENCEKGIENVWIPSQATQIKNLIKSLRPSWKPSEEQMSMLRAVINDPNNSGAESCQIALRGIYEQLKKL